jgi:hypothetical protein
MSTQQIGLSYGVLSDTLSKQLDNQGFKYDAKKIKEFETELEAIHTLRFGSGLLTDSMVDKIIAKLHKKIVAHVARKNGVTVNK